MDFNNQEDQIQSNFYNIEQKSREINNKSSPAENEFK
jgi:hypothetical protein